MTLTQHAREIFSEALAYQDNPAVIDMIATRLERIQIDAMNSGIDRSVSVLLREREPEQVGQ